MGKIINFDAKRFAILESGILRSFAPIPKNPEDYDPKDLTYVCMCGSIRWCLRKDNKIECYNCGSVLGNSEWQVANDNIVHVSEQIASYPSNNTEIINRPSPSAEGVERLKADCYKALKCLYLATDGSIADDVNAKVKAYIAAIGGE